MTISITFSNGLISKMLSDFSEIVFLFFNLVRMCESNRQMKMVQERTTIYGEEKTTKLHLNP